ncbi:MAG: hypothetical protein U0992_17250 [Planctomycetaceae bacterium]
MSADVWLYRPDTHKTEHHERDRIIPIGPKGQDILRPYLLREKETHCFRPVDSEEARGGTTREPHDAVVLRQPAGNKPDAETEANRGWTVHHRKLPPRDPPGV